jgi:hypothetical protein
MKLTMMKSFDCKTCCAAALILNILPNIYTLDASKFLARIED